MAWWFVPIFWLFRPYQVIKEIYLSSRPNTLDNYGTDQGEALRSSILGWWWAMWLISIWVGGFTVQSIVEIIYGDDTIEALIAVSYVSIVSDILVILAGIFAFMVARQITAFQDTLWDEISKTATGIVAVEE